jgi:hypothetical protein
VWATALAAVGGYDPAARWAEDWDLWMRLILRGHRAGLVQAPLYEYRQHATSLTAQTVDLALGVLSVLHRARPLIDEDKRSTVLTQTEREWRVRAAQSARAAGDPRRWALLREAVLSEGQSVGVRARLLAAAVVPEALRFPR